MADQVARPRRRLVLLAAAVLMLSVCTGDSPAGAEGGGVPVHAAFLGDSYTYGIGATEPTAGYAYRVASDERWTTAVVGLPGSGYVRVALHSGKAIAAGLAPAIAAHPSLVIVECGHNDARRGIRAQEVEANALTDLRMLHSARPEATIVVLGPIWLDGHPGPRVLAVRAAVHAAQRQIPGSLWIDPIAERWFTGAYRLRSGDDTSMINYTDGHPDDAGYEHIARRLERDLRSLGVH